MHTHENYPHAFLLARAFCSLIWQYFARTSKNAVYIDILKIGHYYNIIMIIIIIYYIIIIRIYFILLFVHFFTPHRIAHQRAYC